VQPHIAQQLLRRPSRLKGAQHMPLPAQHGHGQARSALQGMQRE
jgi:hypothetical protein